MTFFYVTSTDPIALPPCSCDRTWMGGGAHWSGHSHDCPERTPRPMTGDVVLLAGGGLVVTGYLTATVLPIFDRDELHDRGLPVEWMTHVCQDYRGQWALWTRAGADWDITDIDLPGAESGGVVVTFEPVVCTCTATSPRERIAEGRHCAMQVATDLPTGAPLPAAPGDPVPKDAVSLTVDIDINP